MKLEVITSKKHPGATFLKVKDTADLFVAKFYPGQRRAALWFKEMVESLTPEEEEALNHFDMHPMVYEIDSAESS